ncbi:MAG: tandem-95 repeat protein, partial [Desulfobacterales bacterium]
RVLAADKNGQSPGWTETAMFFVRQTNHDPIITGIPETSIYQDEDYSFTPTAHDPDPGDQLSFSITNKPDWAQFDPESGTLSGTPGNEHVGVSEDIVITVTDADGASASLAPFDIEVINVNDPPRAENDAYTIDEDTPLMVEAPGVLENDVDVDAGDTLLARLVESTANGILNLNNDGSFTYIPGHNYYGEDSFTYVASDGKADSDIAAVHLTITPVNDSPEVSAIEDAVISENTAISDIAFTVSDAEDAAGDIEITVSSDNQYLVPDENIIVSRSGADFTITVIPVQNRHGRALITVTATDSEGESTYITFTVEVAPRTEPPSVRYFLLNPDLLTSTLCVTSLEDENHITAGAESLDLDQYESAVIPTTDLNQGDVVSGTGHFSISSSAPETGMPAPEAFAGRHFVIPHLRGEHMYYICSPYGDSSVRIELGDRTEDISIPKGEVEAFNAGSNNSISSVITADMPVVISHAAIWTAGCVSAVMDVYPVAPASRDLWGIRADDTHIGAMEDNTTVSVLRADGTRKDHLLDAGSVMEIPRGRPGFLPKSGKPDRSVYITADKPIAAVQKDHKIGDGATVLLESAYLAKQYAIPMDADSITVVCPEPDTEVKLHNKGKQPVIKTCGAAGDTPASVVFRSRGRRYRIEAGAYLESTKPVYVIFEPDNHFFENRNLLGAGYPEREE